MTKYQIVINFATNRPLTSDEQFQIVGACQVQVEEPVNAEGDDMEVEIVEINSRITEG